MFNLFIMIYKFEKENDSNQKILEISVQNKSLRFYIDEYNVENGIYIDLNKEDVFKLIGALHLIHKEL